MTDKIVIFSTVLDDEEYIAQATVHGDEFNPETLIESYHYCEKDAVSEVFDVVGIFAEKHDWTLKAHVLIPREVSLIDMPGEVTFSYVSTLPHGHLVTVDPTIDQITSLCEFARLRRSEAENRVQVAQETEFGTQPVPFRESLRTLRANASPVQRLAELCDTIDAFRNDLEDVLRDLTPPPAPKAD